MKNKLFIIDTNTLISAFLFKGSNPRKAFDKATETGKVCVSIETYDELREVFLRPKFNRYITAARKLLVLKELHEIVVFTETAEAITDCRDPKDNKFLELGLHPFRGIPILNAVDFINNF